MPQLLLLVTTLFCAGSAFGKANGVDSRASFETVGCGSSANGEQLGCHVQDANAALTVTIEGPVQIDPGPQGVGTYTLSVPVGSLGLMGAGMNVEIAAPNAAGCALEKFFPLDKMGFQNEIPGGDPVLSHAYQGDPPPSTLVGVWSYQFLVLNCQSPGPLLLRAAMNAFDGSGDETGEVWNETQLGVTVPEPGAAWLGAGALAALRILSWGRSWRRCLCCLQERPQLDT